ncbi:ClpXP protease specificity-enhancing factor [Parahaliea sp. F7430]|uniref:ClpXP protease specificity-enhancing factor n=1 Tax=Sediminihaliea albiluteola TaxID=2758564 RepID=A0A7W2TW10_9GAMM|nr:ClpXP protease specificity-enhancing factor [Sediminihaliea albiluteola]MBA6412975.1 ClpXP protease specificity-enhancing factor [Sediminihaliea albiluteola]
MTPSRPYIMRALYEWIVDNNCTPYLLVDASIRGVEVPEQYVKDGQIVLNISPSAVVELNMANDVVTFNGRFGGVATDIMVPVSAVIGIYARENGQGMVFEAEQPPEDPDDDPKPPSPADKPQSRGEGRPSLKIVK